jgi:hypothetical protein
MPEIMTGVLHHMRPAPATYTGLINGFCAPGACHRRFVMTDLQAYVPQERLRALARMEK